MADLQIKLEASRVSEAGEQFSGKLFSGSCRLRCWPDGASVPGDPTVIDRVVSANYKDIGDTVDNQLTTWGKKIKAQAQQIIDAYNREQALLANDKLAAAVSVIEGQLTG